MLMHFGLELLLVSQLEILIIVLQKFSNDLIVATIGYGDRVPHTCMPIFNQSKARILI